MKKIYSLFLILSLVVGWFIYCDLKSPENLKTSEKSHEINKIQPEILTFHFQPALDENTEVIINFDKKYLVFRTMYPFFPEPPPPPGKDGRPGPYTNQRKSVKPYLADLSDDDLTYFKNLIKSLSTNDYNRIEDVHLDGTSYNFGILFSNKTLKNGFIAQDKTENQKKIIIEILRLLHKTNPHQNNLEILQYYSRHW